MIPTKKMSANSKIVSAKIYSLEREIDECAQDVSQDASFNIQLNHIASKMDNVFRRYKYTIKMDEGLNMIQLVQKMKLILRRRNSSEMLSDTIRLHKMLDELLYDLQCQFEEPEQEEEEEEYRFNPFSKVIY